MATPPYPPSLGEHPTTPLGEHPTPLGGPPPSFGSPWASRPPLLLLLGALCMGWWSFSCGYRWVGANPEVVGCMLPLENLSNEVAAGQIFDMALRSQLFKAGGGGGARGGGCLRARLLQLSRDFLTSRNFRLIAVLELSLEKEGFRPIHVVQSEEFNSGADVLLTEAALRATLVRLAEKTAQKGLEHIQIQWRPIVDTS
ncbi:MAG: hypothetical protein FWB81_04315 [Cystobacterineae bacterium]|nr:hypothetical protein [Cystobacterineae bacterium]